MRPSARHLWLPLPLGLVCIVCYGIFAYELQRNDSVKLLTLWSLLFACSYTLMKYLKGAIRWTLTLGLVFRLVFLVAMPNLSQDFYRFIWDGRLLAQGLNPYLYLPDTLISTYPEVIPQAKELYQGMGSLSSGHYTNYPPVNQFCFAIAGFLSGKSILGAVVAMRLIIILADIGILYFGQKLLKSLGMSIAPLLFWFFLNPFIIIELTGNLHFEGVMVFFLIWSLYLLHKGNWRASAVLLALSVSVKLIPLLFLPLFFQTLRWRKSIAYYAIVGGVTLLLFSPFFSQTFIDHYAETVGLWFTNFEFNASIYYLLREIGYMFRGYNEIEIIGKILAVIVFLFISGMAIFRKNTPISRLLTSMLFAMSIYLFVATTVHPWYLVTLVVLAIFTPFRYPMLWCVTVVLSYVAYSHTNHREQGWTLLLEYVPVYGMLCWELIRVKGHQRVSS